jgi:hypothetical protein
MKNKTKDELISEWKQMRGSYFNLLNEDEKKFEKFHKNHPLFNSVIKHFDKSFKDINQLAESEINTFINKKNNI